MGSWDAFRPKKWFGPRPVPSALYLFRKYYGTKLSLLSLLKTLPPAIIPYQFKKSKKGIILGFILTAFIFPIIMMQILKSWRLASIKIKEGPLIENLK